VEAQIVTSTDLWPCGSLGLCFGFGFYCWLFFLLYLLWFWCTKQLKYKIQKKKMI